MKKSHLVRVSYEQGLKGVCAWSPAHMHTTPLVKFWSPKDKPVSTREPRGGLRLAFYKQPCYQGCFIIMPSM